MEIVIVHSKRAHGIPNLLLHQTYGHCSIIGHTYIIHSGPDEIIPIATDVLLHEGVLVAGDEAGALAVAPAEEIDGGGAEPTRHH